MSVTSNNVNLNPDELEEMQILVRDQMRDFAPVNIVLDDVEFEDSDIERCIGLATSKVNAMTPTTSYGWRNIPESIIFTGTTRYLMQSESFLQIRNQIQVQADDLGAVGLDDKFELYHRMEQSLREEFRRDARMWKNQVNMEQAFGSVSSGYRNVSRFHD